MRKHFSRDREVSIHDRAVAELSSRALQNNYEAIRAQVPGQAILPMIKADGYGHGAEWVARQLMVLDDLYGFGVATLEEGGELRRELGSRGRRVKIIVFSGAAPWSEAKGQYCERFGLTPVIARDEDWHLFLKEGWPAKLGYQLKFNTGMNRLGMTPGLAASVARALKPKSTSWHPEGVFSHLAMAESPDAPLSISQRECFEQVKRELANAFPSTQFHLANSAAVWNQKLWRLDGLTDIVRPGISLYGIPPWPGAPARGLISVMTLRAAVTAFYRLKPGESLGYGATFVVSGKQGEHPVRAAVLSAGYADGVHRALSNRGEVWLNGRSEKILGAISMDLFTVGCTGEVRVGDWAEWMGPNVDPWTQARAAGTIPYELLTSVSSRVQRKYV